MTTNGDVPGPELERELSVQELEAFKETFVWPSVDFLWRGNFREFAKPDVDELCIDRKLMGGQGLQRIEFSAECLPDDDDYGAVVIDVGKLCIVKLVVKQIRPDLTHEVLKTALVGMSDENYEPVVDEEIQAWDTKHYYFDTDDEDNLVVEPSLELLDPEGAVFWCDHQMNPETKPQESTGTVLTQEEEDALKRIDDDLESRFTEGDKLLVASSLICLGVPSQLFE